MNKNIRVAILDDHQSIIDGYVYRLSMSLDIKIVGTCLFGSELEAMLSGKSIDVLLMDLSVPISSDNQNIFPIRHELKKLFVKYPSLKVIAISVFSQKSLVQEMIKIGVSGYIVKEDQNAIKNLARIVQVVAGGGLYLSANVDFNASFSDGDELLTPRQREALSLCVAYPDATTSVLAHKMEISSSTFRNILSGAYQRLGVRTRNAAVKRVAELEIVLQKRREKTGRLL